MSSNIKIRVINKHPAMKRLRAIFANRCVSAEDKTTVNETKDTKKMKTKILTLILSLTVMLTFAQTSEHLSFKGVPIDGTLNEYVSKMKNSGFTLIGIEDGVAMLKGDFAAY
jgi:hypothetical protein